VLTDALQSVWAELDAPFSPMDLNLDAESASAELIQEQMQSSVVPVDNVL